MARTTRSQIEAQATYLARLLNYRGAYVNAGSVVNGVAWSVTLTTADTYAQAWDDGQVTRTFSLSFRAGETYATLRDMAQGAQMRADLVPVPSAHFVRDDRVSVSIDN